MDALGEPFSVANGRMLLVGVGSGALVAGAVVARPRAPVGALAVVAALVLAMGAAGRLDDVLPLGLVDLAGLGAALWAGAGARAAHRAGGLGRWGVPAAVVVSLAGVWAAVPENRQVVVAVGALAALGLVSALVGRPVTPPGVACMAGAVAWTVAAGSAYTDVSYVGGLLCLGLLLWWPVLTGALARPAQVAALAVLAAGHLGVVLVAARWVGAATGAGWVRVALVAGSAGCAAGAARVALAHRRGRAGRPGHRS